ncbi:pyrroline-5-carboxylate reductase [Kurthia zopfii]|uniref:Pyrroline-5-carboxylate reductase n=1 Tax=Kurthia zopfii TaxID=1650 RepID=A0A8B4QB24_9BACL|nr:pyrroline-5-carboxylate reductase [Kurthia zopfii]PWI23207.1 pyrroline-5-carboxylate reductase [Kurthia zopfii]TDR41387.1 pyrroline-5-carboxylate reductase [Kurthia zopfii]GEK30030.1 pyrroline-5-carboxylate reductase [Kurthia zopfii]STX09892.1 Pyrroline-5-carboxylate reductase [Kurthia zopfii]
MKYGWIGLGNMTTAIIKGMLHSNKYDKASQYGFNRTFEKTVKLQQELGIVACEDLSELLDCDVIVIGVQPQHMDDLLPKLKGQLNAQQVVVSIAAGKSLNTLQQAINHDRIIRIMPNINAIAGASTSGMVSTDQVTLDQKEAVKSMFNAVGKVFEIPEEQFDLFSAIAGASPAFSYLYIDSLARAAVMEGMDKKTALDIASHAVLGSAQMIQTVDEHPWELVDQVCSPGGTTIQGVTSLQNNHFASTIYDAVKAVIERDRVLK